MGHTNIPVVRDMLPAGKDGMNNCIKKKLLFETCVKTNNTKVLNQGKLVQVSRAIIVHADFYGLM